MIEWLSLNQLNNTFMFILGWIVISFIWFIANHCDILFSFYVLNKHYLSGFVPNIKKNSNINTIMIYEASWWLYLSESGYGASL